jgi:hypothetical protein
VGCKMRQISRVATGLRKGSQQRERKSLNFAARLAQKRTSEFREARMMEHDGTAARRARASANNGTVLDAGSL